MLFNRRGFILSACALGGCLPNDVSQPLTDPTPNQLIAVGRIEITPLPAQADFTGKRKVIGQDLIANRVITNFVAQRPLGMASYPSLGKGHISAPIGELFHAPIDRTRLYLDTVFYYREAHAGSVIRLPGGLRIDPPKDAQILYLGTIKFHLDDFWAVTKVDVLDHSTKDIPILRQKYGANVQIARLGST